MPSASAGSGGAAPLALVANEARVPVGTRVAHHLLVVPVGFGILRHFELLEKLAGVGAARYTAPGRHDHRLLRVGGTGRS